MNDYGPLATIVAYAGNLGAAAVAMRVAWTGKATKWEPEIPELAKAPTRVAGLLALLAIAVLFVRTRTGDDFDWLLWLMGWAGGITLLAFLAYLFLVMTLVFTCDDNGPKTVRGYWLTPTAKKVLAGDSDHLLPGQPPPHNDKEFFCGSGRSADRVWPDSARALAHISLVLAYILFIAPGTIAVSSASIAMEKALAGP